MARARGQPTAGSADREQLALGRLILVGGERAAVAQVRKPLQFSGYRNARRSGRLRRPPPPCGLAGAGRASGCVPSPTDRDVPAPPKPPPPLLSHHLCPPP